MWSLPLVALLGLAVIHPGVEYRDDRAGYAMIATTDPGIVLIRRTNHGWLYQGHTKGLRYPRLRHITVSPYAIPKWYKKIGAKS